MNALNVLRAKLNNADSVEVTVSPEANARCHGVYIRIRKGLTHAVYFVGTLDENHSTLLVEDVGQ